MVKAEKAQRRATLLLVVVFTLVFLFMIRQFLLVILLAGIFAALVHPLYRRINRLLGNRKSLASATTLVLFFLVVLIPAAILFGIVANQAVQVTQSVAPWVKKQLETPAAFSDTLESLPFYGLIEPHEEVIVREGGKIVERAGEWMMKNVSRMTLGTVNALFMTFVFLYTLFFFIKDGRSFLDRFMAYLPLEKADKDRMLEKFTSVTRATLKGVAVIGLLQGLLGGAAFAVAGIKGAVFWGTVMTVLSIIPGIGTGLVWTPAAIILAAGGEYVTALLLFLFCAIVVGSVDNLLRPRLIGKDTRMHDLFIFFSTFGGLAMFGILGFIVGPIIAALFITGWEIYANVFRDAMPAKKEIPSG